MKKIIRDITSKLKNGTITVEEANKKLIDLFELIKGNSISKIMCVALGCLLMFFVLFAIAILSHYH